LVKLTGKEDTGLVNGLGSADAYPVLPYMPPLKLLLLLCPARL
jgi:hypothetical protein